MPKLVFPVPGRFLSGVPHVAHECTDRACVESGAFTHDPPAEAEPTQPDPADAGSLDSREQD